MITYVWQPTDDVFQVSAKFNASPADIEAENGYGKNFSAAVGLPVLIPVSQLPALSQSYPPQQSHSKHHWIFLVLVMSFGVAVLMFLLSTLLVYAYCFRERIKKSSTINRMGSSLETSDLIQTRNKQKAKPLRKSYFLEFRTTSASQSCTRIKRLWRQR